MQFFRTIEESVICFRACRKFPLLNLFLLLQLGAGTSAVQGDALHASCTRSAGGRARPTACAAHSPAEQAAQQALRGSEPGQLAEQAGGQGQGHAAHQVHARPRGLVIREQASVSSFNLLLFTEYFLFSHLSLICLSYLLELVNH